VLDGTARAVAAPDGAPEAAGDGVTVAWVFEGAAATVEWQRRECARLGLGRAEGFREADAEEAAALLEGAASFGETDGGSPADVGVARLAVLPSALAATAAAVAEAFAARPETRAGTVADAATGLLTVRWNGPAESIDAPVAALREIAGAKDGTGRLLHLPGAARRRHRHSLLESPNEALAESVLAAFDPHGTFTRRQP
jgi:hypothetical protein